MPVRQVSGMEIGLQQEKEKPQWLRKYTSELLVAKEACSLAVCPMSQTGTGGSDECKVLPHPQVEAARQHASL